ncbi:MULTISPECIES: hypothetical protein [unclassified Sphingomonas]|uniref:hypothetical protein n=1 Tax=unclassified Sphingomonas TaxID=196159 RepID=UPI0006F83864|nr:MULTISPECIES: hypothetical protein [unclassified Sphingomonas]KQX17682.1 hypothetical protein ASD17_18315 [Sphingomonas sp. Root1294]KQY70608.1 hypothetical protein ASD39_22215 [Sphingomonas sp. Root50]KRB91901.1 hypothetical protein ASE22_08095 [Sphingomonas sp. Root720]
MFNAKIVPIDNGPADMMANVAALRFMTEALGDLAGSVTKDCSPQPAAEAGSAPSLATGYASACPVARRRFEAILREAETIGTTGLKLMAARGGRTDAGTIAAARFLGSSLDASIRRLEALVLRRTA